MNTSPLGYDYRDEKLKGGIATSPRDDVLLGQHCANIIKKNPHSSGLLVLSNSSIKEMHRVLFHENNNTGSTDPKPLMSEHPWHSPLATYFLLVTYAQNGNINADTGELGADIIQHIISGVTDLCLGDADFWGEYWREKDIFSLEFIAEMAISERTSIPVRNRLRAYLEYIDYDASKIGAEARHQDILGWAESTFRNHQAMFAIADDERSDILNYICELSITYPKWKVMEINPKSKKSVNAVKRLTELWANSIPQKQILIDHDEFCSIILSKSGSYASDSIYAAFSTALTYCFMGGLIELSQEDCSAISHAASRLQVGSLHL